MGKQDITRGYRGQKDIATLWGTLHVLKVTREKGTPPPHPDKGKTERGSICERLERGKRGLQGVSKSALHFSMSSFSSF